MTYQKPDQRESPVVLPYDKELMEPYGIDEIQWKMLTESVFPAAKSTASILMAVDHCKKRGIDVMKKVVHILPAWNSSLKKAVDHVCDSIDGLRGTASRTREYAGKDETMFGKEMKLSLKSGHDIKYPEWARVTVYRMVHGVRCPFVGPKVMWMERCVTNRATSEPNEMWSKNPSGQLEKCAEAAALRCAFPEELGGIYTLDEVDGQSERPIERPHLVPKKKSPIVPLSSGLEEMALEEMKAMGIRAKWSLWRDKMKDSLMKLGSITEIDKWFLENKASFRICKEEAPDVYEETYKMARDYKAALEGSDGEE